MRKAFVRGIVAVTLLIPSLAAARPDRGGFDLHDDVHARATTVNDRHATVTSVHDDVHVSNTRNVTVVDPRYGSRPAWSWNHGVAWAPVGRYWGGGFWGPFALGAAAAVAGAVAYGAYVNAEHQSLISYQIHSGTPGATLLNAYRLEQVRCGPPGLVVILGPSSSVVCAAPNSLVAAGEYTVTPSTLTLASA